MMAPSARVEWTTAPSPTVQSVRWLAGPTTAPSPTLVAPSRIVPGSSTVSGRRARRRRRRCGRDRRCSPRPHQALEVPAAQDGGLRELHAVVHPATSAAGAWTAWAPAPPARELRDDVGEVALTLRVVAAERGDERLDRRAVEHVHAGVDLADAPLLGVRVAVLDDPDDRAVRRRG
jgi:hypothetical protein